MKRRTKYLVKKRMQLGVTLRFILFTILFSIFIGWEVFVTIWPPVSGFIPVESMDFIKSRIFYRLLFFIFPLIFVLAALSILFSHRIAGPLYRLEKTIEQFLQGKDVEPIRLRRNDELKGLASKINDLIIMVKESKQKKRTKSKSKRN